MERRKFEESFKDAFQSAEEEPSENVWTNIELELEKEEGGAIRRRLLFYKLVAAASVAFAMCVAGVGYYATYVSPVQDNLAIDQIDNATTVTQFKKEENVSNEQIAEANFINRSTSNESNLLPRDSSKTSASPSKERNSKLNSGNTSNAISHQNKVIRKSGEQQLSNQIASQQQANPRAGDAKNLSTTDHRDGQRNQLGSVITDYFEKNNSNVALQSGRLVKQRDRSLPSFFTLKNPELVIPDNTPDPGTLLLAKLAAEEQAYAKHEKSTKRQNEKLWTSVGFAAGSFSGSSTSAMTNSPSILVGNTRLVDQQAKASGSSYSMGVSLGAHVSERWVIQGGVNYLSQFSDFALASTTVSDASYMALTSSKESVNRGNATLAWDNAGVTAPLSVNNAARFMSVPVQAGYLLLNSKLGVQLNAGLSTDLFLQNTLAEEGNSDNRINQSRGGESPYRALNFSGLMGTELTYKIGSQYRVALNPGIRYPLNSIYKNASGVDATPLTFDVGLRFRYIFQ